VKRRKFIRPQRAPEARVLDESTEAMSIAEIDILGKIVSSGLVAVIRAENPNQAERIAEACALGGVGALEITFTVPEANRVIEHLAKQVSNQILLGADTVLDPETARIAILARVQFCGESFAQPRNRTSLQSLSDSLHARCRNHPRSGRGDGVWR